MQDDAQLAQIFQYLVPAVALTMPFIGWVLSKKSLKTIALDEALSDKLRKYQGNLLLKYAFFEGPTLLALVAYFLTGEKLFLGIALGLILWFLTQIPTKNRLFEDIPLLPSEESKLNNPDAEVADMPVKD
jgi:hypothetical protein